MTRGAPTVACVVIGDEVLSGKTTDTNGAYLMARLRSWGASLRRLCIVPDEAAAITAEVRAQAGSGVDAVITSGGVGPTHDDITLPAVAQALDRPLELNRELLERFARRLGQGGLRSGHERMARLPRGATLRWDQAGHHPLIQIENVYCLPGIPRLFRGLVDLLEAELSGSPFVARSLFLAAPESEIAGALSAAQEAAGEVRIGSYPRIEACDHRVRVDVEARSAEAVAAVCADLRRRLPAGCVVREEEG